MSLLEPNLWDQIKPYKMWLIYAGLGIVLIGMALGFYSCGSDYFFKRGIDKLKANVNTTLAEANKVSANIAAEKEAANRIATNVKIATNEYFDATNTTDQTRESVDAAINRMHNAANSNTGNVNAAELSNLLKGL